MEKATLKIIFLNLLSNQQELNLSLFDEIVLNGNKMEIKNNSIEAIIDFNDFEKINGIKICTYELLKKNEKYNFNAKGEFELYLGYNVGYCFIDVIGISLDISYLFLQNKEVSKSFLEENVKLSLKCDMKNYNDSIQIKPNNLNTSDRANILLINCPIQLIMEFNDNIIAIEEITNKIDYFDPLESYQVCFHNEDFQNFCYKKIDPFEELKFKEMYSSNLNLINKTYDDIMKELNSNDNTFVKKNKISAICFKNKKDFRSITHRKYNYTNDILEKEINQENYIEYIFKSVYLTYIYDLVQKYDYKEDVTVNKMEQIHKKLLENKKIIIKDKLLKICEKFILILELYYSKILYNENNYIINYFNLRKIQENSPLYFASNFINKFIDELNEESNFYYPLLSIDSDYYECNVNKKDNNNTINISCYGFNMLSIEQIKFHLKKLFPNILILSNDFPDEYASTNPNTGIITLDSLDFEGINIDKNNMDKYISKHFGFKIVKNLFHEFMGHKKSAFTKNNNNFNSVISFKDKDGNLLFLSENNEKDLYKNINEIIDDPQIEIEKEVGDSGYFMEYFFGKIENKYTMKIVDEIETKCYLGALLEPLLWHTNIYIVKEYIRLKYKICQEYGNKIKINEDSDLKGQIEEMKLKISQTSKMELIGDFNKGEDIKMIGFKKRRNDDNNKEYHVFSNKKKRGKNFYNHPSVNYGGKTFKSRRLRILYEIQEYLREKNNSK